MRKKKLHNICFYIFKYILMLMPLILLLIVEIFPTKKIENNYNNVETTSTETETTINFNQLKTLDNSGWVAYNSATNQFSVSYNNTSITFTANSDFTNVATYVQIFKRGYINNLSIGDKILICCDIELSRDIYGALRFYPNSNGTTFTINANEKKRLYNIFTLSSNANDSEYSILLSGNNNFLQGETITISNYQLFDLTKMGLSDITYEDFNNLFPLDYYAYNESQQITLSSLTITNTISDSSNVVSSNESREVNTTLLTPFTSLYNLSVNNWYMDILDTIGLDTDNEITKYIACMPLWVLWVELFYLIGFCLSLIPKLFNRWLSFDD